MNTIPQVVFQHGDEFFYPDRSVKAVSLRSLRSEQPLPRNMWARYEVTYLADGKERVNLILQARSKHGRRYDFAASEFDAQRRILRWANRVMLERAREGSWEK